MREGRGRGGNMVDGVREGRERDGWGEGGKGAW